MRLIGYVRNVRVRLRVRTANGIVLGRAERGYGGEGSERLLFSDSLEEVGWEHIERPSAFSGIRSFSLLRGDGEGGALYGVFDISANCRGKDMNESSLASARRAKKGMGGEVAKFPEARFLKFLEHLLIQSKDAGLVRFEMLESQRYLLDEIISGLEAGITTFVILKARQLGISTFLLALDLFWAFEYPGINGVFATHDEGSRDQFRNQLEVFIGGLPKGYKVSAKASNVRMLILNNLSTFRYLVAGTRATTNKLGRSGGCNYCHACMAPGTPVIVENGRIKAVENVEVGDRVITHNGNWATVIDVLGQKNTKGDLIEITPWLGTSIKYTAEHKIPTRRGIVQAGDIRKDDELIMPIRTITHEVTEIVLPPDSLRPHGGGRRSAGANAIIELDEEFGFACGYYLAEGCMLHQATGTPLGIAFARHRNEEVYSDRAVNALERVIAKTTTLDKKDCLTTVVTVFGMPLAVWMKQTFGITDGKIIPDEVFTWGEDFCRGLLAGLLCGDGSKTAGQNQGYQLPRVILPTTRSSIAMQARDLAASLGYGWASCSYKAAGNHYGRNCKPCWRIVWCGTAARNMRELMGLTNAPGGHKFTEKYKIEDDKVYVKIRSIVHGIKEDVIWDISVDHDDHTFRTPSMSTSNTEYNFWGSGDDLHAMRQTFSKTYPHRLYIFESTANGYNFGQEMWQVAETSPAQKAVFIGWWRDERNEFGVNHPFYIQYMPEGVLTPLSRREKQGIAEVKERYGFDITAGQVAWYRCHLETECSGDQSAMDQEMPWTADDAFISTGSTFFATDTLTKLSKEASKFEMRPFNFRITEQFTDTTIQPTVPKTAELKIWEAPVAGAQYVIGADPIFGSSENRDNGVICIGRAYSDRIEQVAEYTSPSIAAYQYAWVIAYLAGLYKDVLLNIEITGPGAVVYQELKQLRQKLARITPGPDDSMKNCLKHMRDFLYTRADSLSGHSLLQWKSNPELRKQLMFKFRDGITANRLKIKSKHLIDEMRYLSIDGGYVEVPSGKRDDRIFGAALMYWAWDTRVRNRMERQRGLSFAETKEREASGDPNRILGMVEQHLKNSGITL